MDPRQSIFSLWRDPQHSELLAQVYDRDMFREISGDSVRTDRCTQYLKFVKTTFTCGDCGQDYDLNSAKQDSNTSDMLLIAANPTRYLLEDEYILCNGCFSERGILALKNGQMVLTWQKF